MTRNASVGACLIVASIFTPIQGGSATVYSNLCRYAPKGRMVALATRRDYNDGAEIAGWRAHDQNCGFPVYRLDLLRPRISRPAHKLIAAWRFLTIDVPLRLRVIWTVWRLIRRHGIEVICIGELASTAWLGEFFQRVFGKRMVIYVHGEEITTRFDAGSFGASRATHLRAADAVVEAYARDETDEFIQPTVIDGYTGARDGDGFFSLNFRADRAREILAAIGQPDFDAFDTVHRPEWAALLGMVDYSAKHDEYMTAAYPKRQVVNTLGAWVAAKGLRQFRLAETEKYPHVTFFLNGGKETPETGEDRFMPSSPKVATYDLAPEMAAAEVSAKLVEVIEGGYDLVVVNFANPDMVGHTGSLPAAIRACEAVDKGLGMMLAALEKTGGAAVVIADHGNCETMIDPVTGGPHTAHTTNPVPVIVFGGPAGASTRKGRLADVAPTVLDLMGLDLPPEMTGKTLIERA